MFVYTQVVDLYSSHSVKQRSNSYVSVLGSRYYRKRNTLIVASRLVPANIAQNVHRWFISSVLDEEPPSEDAILVTTAVRMRN